MPIFSALPLMSNLRFSLARLWFLGLTAAVLALVAGSPMEMLGQAASTVPAEAYGPYNAAFLLDGAGLEKRLDLHDALLSGNAKWTLALWFKTAEAKPSGTLLLAGIGDSAAKDARFIELENGHLGLRMGGKPSVVADAPSDMAGWHCAVAVGDGQKTTLYADGKAVASTSQTPGAVAPILQMAPVLAGISHFGGKIASLKIFREALSADQVAALATARPGFWLLNFEEASAHWQVQTRGMAGQVTPQDPSTLPRGKGGVQAPVAKTLREADLTNELVGSNPWILKGGWRLAEAPLVRSGGAKLSMPGRGHGSDGWLAATVPGTVLTTMIDRGIYPDSDYGLNNLAIPENLAHQDYWYRVEFKAPVESAGKRLTLTFEGINYAAEIWLNGKKLGGVTGAFVRGKFDVTGLLTATSLNALAVRVSPPPHPGIANEESIKGGPGENGGIQMIDGPTFAATEGWDWIPGIRDRNTGIWQDVTLTASGDVTVGDLNVITTLPKPDRSEADIEIEAPLTNATGQALAGELTALFDDVKVVKHLSLEPGETVVRLKPEEFAQLKVQHPRLWWPNGYGEPALHKLTVNFAIAGALSSEQKIDFGMREVSYETSLFDQAGRMRRVEVLPSRTHDEALALINERHDGIRQIDDPNPNILPAGQKVPDWERRVWVQSLEKGAEGSASIRAVEGGWPGTDLVLKVNGVRIAARGGNWGMDDSRKRVSLEHLEPYFRLHRDAHVNIIRDWMGQDTEENFYALADKYGLMVWNDFWESTENYNLEAQDPGLFLLNARDSILHFRHHASIVVWCGRNEGVPQPILNERLATLVRTLDHTRYYTGSSNLVNLRNSGPYQLQPLDSYYRINRGFSVELGIPSVPTLEGIKSFIPEADQWPISDTWAYHDWHQTGNGTVAPFMKAMETEFGAPTSLKDFERKAQMLDYAGHRAIFEGFAAHLWQPNSARMIWMTQPAWPSMEWNFLGSDYDTQSSFYGTQKACEPVHAQLDLTDGSVDLIRLSSDPGDARSFQVRTRVVGLDGKLVSEKTNQILAAANARTAVTKPDLAKLANGHTVLVQLQVSDAGGVPVSDNLYWWAKEDATLRELNGLSAAKLSASATLGEADGERKVKVKIKNSGTVPALMIKLTLKNEATEERILPAYYSENYVSLLPGEERVVSILYPAGTAKPSIGVRGWNVEEQTAAVE